MVLFIRVLIVPMKLDKNKSVFVKFCQSGTWEAKKKLLMIFTFLSLRKCTDQLNWVNNAIINVCVRLAISNISNNDKLS